MGELLSQDDLNALLGPPSEDQRPTPRQEATIVGIDIESLLSQNDLDALLAEKTSQTGQSPPRGEKTALDGNKEGLLSQDDLNALFGGTHETKAAAQEMIPNPEAPVTESKGESMSQDEIDDLLRQFDRDI